MATPTPRVKNLIVDSSPLLTAPLSALRHLAQSYLITPDVVAELRDKKGREVLHEAELQLLPPEGSNEKGGFKVKEPTLEAIAKITAFARKTGDIAVLSAADIRVLALCLTLELEENGSWRVRDHPGQVLTGPPPPVASVAADEKKETVEDVTEKLGKAGLDSPPQPEEEAQPVASTSASTSALDPAPAAEDGAEDNYDEDEDKDEDEDHDEDDDEDGNSSDSSGNSWITPDNVIEHKVKDLGLFTAPTDADGQPSKPKTVMKAAVLTGDFAMQNVGIQMGLNVLGSGGKTVREVRTWVLRCHACYKICKNPEKRFCPSCGGATLLRTSITYVPATPENPLGYILHLKQNFQYRLRGTQYSLPNPKMGRAGGGVHAEPVLREDQKEWIRGVKTAEVRQSKEMRAVLRGVMDDKRRGTTQAFGRSALDPDWVPPMNRGEKGRKRGGKNGGGGEVRLDSSGMPVIGSGRKNINESRRRH